MLVPHFCGYSLSVKKYDLKPSTLHKYLWHLVDSETATFRVPQKRVDKLHVRIAQALARGSIAFRTLHTMAGQAMDMVVRVPVHPGHIRDDLGKGEIGAERSPPHSGL